MICIDLELGMTDGGLMIRDAIFVDGLRNLGLVNFGRLFPMLGWDFDQRGGMDLEKGESLSLSRQQSP